MGNPVKSLYQDPPAQMPEEWVMEEAAQAFDESVADQADEQPIAEFFAMLKNELDQTK